MTRLQIVRTLYGTGVVLQWGHKTHGFYPLRFIGKLIIRRTKKMVESVAGEKLDYGDLVTKGEDGLYYKAVDEEQEGE